MKPVVAAEPSRFGVRFGAQPNGRLMPQIPSGHVDKIKIQVLRNPQTEVNEVQSGSLDWMANQVPPDRYQEILSKYEGTQFRVEPISRLRACHLSVSENVSAGTADWLPEHSVW